MEQFPVPTPTDSIEMAREGVKQTTPSSPGTLMIVAKFKEG
jgi:hypothetical protein